MVQDRRNFPRGLIGMSCVFALCALACVPEVPADRRVARRPPTDAVLDAGTLSPDRQDSEDAAPPVVEPPVSSPVDAGSPAADAAPPEEPEPPEEPVDPAALQYSRDVLPVLEVYCTECHHPGRSLDLTSPPGDRSAREVLADRIIAAAQLSMPPAPRDRLTPAELDLIRRWKADGAQP